MKRRADDPWLPFDAWLRGLRPGEQTRWMLDLAWPAMLRLLTKVKKPERERWYRFFSRLSALERDTTLSKSERGEKFIALHKQAWPAPRGRPAADKEDFLYAAERIEAHLASAWKNGIAARSAAVRVVELAARINLDDPIDDEGRGTNRHEVLATSSAHQATLLILSHIYEEPVKSTEQALLRARRAQAAKVRRHN
jgi:hypothetical protein